MLRKLLRGHLIVLHYIVSVLEVVSSARAYIAACLATESSQAEAHVVITNRLITASDSRHPLGTYIYFAQSPSIMRCCILVWCRTCTF
ncbi:hypothetical protein BDR06DRAFT_105611 [Suillus hirtellus]|nr:hypothetical protein BDR06DRAFT_105611 [Suillus hirtellus]